jgi:hypothetical protein
MQRERSRVVKYSTYAERVVEYICRENGSRLEM